MKKFFIFTSIVSFLVFFIATGTLQATTQRSPGLEPNEQPHVSEDSIRNYLTSFLQAPEFSIYFKSWNTPINGPNFTGTLQLSRQLIRPNSSAPYFLDFVSQFEQPGSQLLMQRARYVTHDKRSSLLSDATGVSQESHDIFHKDIPPQEEILEPVLEIMRFGIHQMKASLVTGNPIPYPKKSPKKGLLPFIPEPKDLLREPFVSSAEFVKTSHGYAMSIVVKNFIFSQLYFETSPPRLLVTTNPSHFFLEKLGRFSEINEQFQSSLPPHNEYAGMAEIEPILANPKLQVLLRNFLYFMELQLAHPAHYSQNCVDSLALPN